MPGIDPQEATQQLQKLMGDFSRNLIKLEEFKPQAMVLVQDDGADFTETDSNPSSRKTLLHLLILSNKNGVNDAEIKQLFALSKTRGYEDFANSKTGGFTTLTPLETLMDDFLDKKISPEDFRHSAMLLVENGADYTVTDSRSTSRKTLLHYLTINNTKGESNAAIQRLFAINKLKKMEDNLADIKGGPISNFVTPLQALMDDFIDKVDKKSAFDDFKNTAMLLVNNGADSSVADTHTSSRLTLMHHFANSGQQDAVNELLEKNPGLVNVPDQSFNHSTPLAAVSKGMMEGKIPLEAFQASAKVLIDNKATKPEIFGTQKSEFSVPSERSAALNQVAQYSEQRSQQQAENKVGLFNSAERKEIHDEAKNYSHAANRNQLIVLLKDYIATVEDHVNAADNTIDFGWNFYILKNMQATNRRANYSLAKDLLNRLEGNPNENIEQLFSKENVATMRLKYATAGFWGGSIWSRKLNHVLDDARHLEKRNDNSYQRRG